MAKVNGNIIIDRVSGTIGDQLVLKRVRGGRTILCKKPTFREDRQFSEAQLARQQAFREASAYARKMKREPLYLALAQGTAQTGYNLALGDWLNPPQVLEIDLGGWRGAAQDLIRMRVQDDVMVAQVRVEITDEAGTVLEAGGGTEAGALWWEYTVAQSLTGELTVTVFASDLPGHVTQASEKKRIPG
jgi:hypothetical protein